MTTKKLHLTSIVHELLWFLKGDTNVRYLRDNSVTIWDEWADENGDLGPVYGKQWRSWAAPDGRTIDQIAWVVDEIKRNPFSRRLDRQRVEPGRPRRDGARAVPLPVPVPCRRDRRRASGCRCNCTSARRDVFLGVPFNIASYALLIAMVAQVTGCEPGDFVHSFGDAHLYDNHVEQARLQLSRDATAPCRGCGSTRQ